MTPDAEKCIAEMIGNFEIKLREIAHRNWTVHQLLVLKDTGRVTGDKWFELAILTLAEHNSILQKQLIDQKMRIPEPLLIHRDEVA